MIDKVANLRLSLPNRKLNRIRAKAISHIPCKKGNDDQPCHRASPYDQKSNPQTTPCTPLPSFARIHLLTVFADDLFKQQGKFANGLDFGNHIYFFKS